MTQAQVAGNELSVAYVSRIESGERRPDLALLKIIARRLETTVDYLLTGVEPQRAREVELQLQYVELALEAGEAVDAESTVRRLLEALSEADDATAFMLARYLLARALEAQGHLAAAIAELDVFRAEDATIHPRWVAAMIATSRIYREAGDLNRAIDVAESACALLRRRGLDGLGESIQLALTLAAAYIERGDRLHALVLCQEAVEHAEQLQSPQLRAYAYWNASAAESELGHHDSALDLAHRALALLAESEDARNLARLRLQVGITMLRANSGDGRQAERALRRARRELASTASSAIDLARCDVYLAQAKLEQEDLAGAEGLAASAIDAVASDSPGVAADAHIVLGRVAAARGDVPAVRRHYHAAAAALSAGATDRSAAQTWYELGDLLDDAGDHAGAHDAYRSAGAAAGLLRTASAPRAARARG